MERTGQMAIEIKGSTPEFFSTALSEHVRIKKMRACKSAGIALYKTWRGGTSSGIKPRI